MSSALIFSAVFLLGCFAIHELGHLIVANIYGYKLKFKLNKYRLVFDIISPSDKKVPEHIAMIGIGGFFFEFLFVALLAVSFEMSFLALWPPFRMLQYLVSNFNSEYNDFVLMAGGKSRGVGR